MGPELAEKLMDMGNLSFGGLVLGQVLADRGFNWWFALLGVAVWLFLFGVASLLLHSSVEER